MQITGEQLAYLIQVLKDSLDIQMGYDWCFTSKRDNRKEFHEALIQSIFSQQSVDVLEVDLDKLKDVR